MVIFQGMVASLPSFCFQERQDTLRETSSNSLQTTMLPMLPSINVSIWKEELGVAIPGCSMASWWVMLGSRCSHHHFSDVSHCWWSNCYCTVWVQR